MNTTERFRKMCRSLSEENYGRIFRSMEKEAGHEPKLPKDIQPIETSQFREIILSKLTSEPQPTAEIWKQAGGNRETLRSLLNGLYNRGEVCRQKVALGGNSVAVWWIA